MVKKLGRWWVKSSSERHDDGASVFEDARGRRGPHNVGFSLWTRPEESFESQIWRYGGRCASALWRRQS